jgi:hypothetical protein
MLPKYSDVQVIYGKHKSGLAMCTFFKIIAVINNIDWSLFLRSWQKVQFWKQSAWIIDNKFVMSEVYLPVFNNHAQIHIKIFSMGS